MVSKCSSVKSFFSRRTLFAGIAMILWVGVAGANEGVFLLGNDPIQLGRGSSGVASPRSAYWSYLNPASMVDLERRFDCAFYTVFTDIDVNPRGILGNTLSGNLESNEIPLIASMGFIYPLETGTLGGGIFVPSGSGVEYPESRNIFSHLFQGNQDRKLSYQHIRGVLSYAYEFDNGWAVGASLQTSLSRFRTDHITLQLHPSYADNDWDEAYGAGLGIGIYKHWDRWAFGASYVTRHWTQTMDKYSDMLSYSLDTPQVFQTGIGYKLCTNLEWTIDYKWLNWKDIPTYGNRLAEGGFNWDDQHAIKTGLEWTVNDKWTLMAGYSYGNTPIDEDHVFLSALVPVTVEQHYTGGFTYTINDKNQVHVVSIYAPQNEMTDSGKGDIFSILGKGSKIAGGAFSVIFGYTYKW